MKNMKCVVMLCLLLTTISLAKGQVIPIDSVGMPNPSQYDGGILFILSVPFVNTFGVETGYQNMHRQLQDAGIVERKPFFKEMFNFGFGYRHKKWFFISDFAVPFTFDFSREPVNNRGRTFHSSHLHYNTTLLVGYDFFQSRRYSYIFRVGIGYGGYVIDITETQSASTIDLQNMSIAPVATAFPRLQHEGVYFDISIDLLQRAKRKVSLSENVAIGYRRGLRQVTWKAEGAEVLNNVVDRTGFLYLKLNYVIGLNREKK